MADETSNHETAPPEPASGSSEPSPATKEASVPPDNHGPPIQVGRFKILLISVALCCAVFCQALDTTVIATAIPRITDEFHSLDDVGWYGAAYLLTNCASPLVYGKLYNLYSIQLVYLVALFIFEVGSVTCAATQNSIGFICGRAVAGIGSGGILSGSILIIANTVPLRKRPIYNGIFGAMYVTASVAGPLLGGVFTQYVTWRLCFWINLPFGAFAAVIVVFFLRKMKPPPRASLPLIEKVKELDLPGVALFFPTTICLLIAIEWGGITYPWSNGRIIALLVVFGVLAVAFSFTEIWQKDRAIIPKSIVKMRTIWACTIYYFFLFGSLLTVTYYLPLWFQAVKGDSASQSGIYTLPLMGGTVVLSIIASGIVAQVGYYTWACIVSSIIGSVGGGLMTLFTPTSSVAYWVGYQALYGAGIGFGLQQPLIAVQAVLPEAQISEGTAFIIFVSTIGGSVFLCIAQNLFFNGLASRLTSLSIPISPQTLQHAGATQIGNLVPANLLPLVKEAYNNAVIQAFYVAVATAALSIFGSALIPWVNIKTVSKEKDSASKTETESSNPAEGEKIQEISEAHPGIRV